MNNWDKKPTMTIIYGEHMSMSTLAEVGAEYADETHTSLKLPVQDMLMYKPKGMTQEHVDAVIAGLQDHIDNTDIRSWTEVQGDYMVTVDGDDLWLIIHMGTYYGQNCKVTVFIAEID